MRLGLIGYSLKHSFSPRFFARKFEQEGIEATYVPYELKDIKEVADLVKKEGLDGFNVTIPYKEDILPFLDELSPAAKEIGAVNCVHISNGKWIGYNTDHSAFADSLEAYLPGIKKAMILGTGGASKAVAYALSNLDIPFEMISRSGESNYRNLTSELIQQVQLIVQTTPMGMQSEEGNAPTIPYRALGPDHLAYDLVYNPPKTLFLQLAKFYGAMIMNGNEMLEKQALLSWEIWTKEGH